MVSIIPNRNVQADDAWEYLHDTKGLLLSLIFLFLLKNKLFITLYSLPISCVLPIAFLTSKSSNIPFILYNYIQYVFFFK